MTGAVLQALATVGRGGGPVAQRAAAWLRAIQNGDGGFGQFKGRPSNAQSTAYAVQGLLAAGSGGGAISRARSYLVGLQRRDGSVAYSSSSTQTPVWVTAQALMALEGKPLPLGTVARSERSRARASSKGDRDGGGAAAGGGKGGSGAAKGGGGDGAEGTAPGEAAAEGIGADPAIGEPTPESEGTTAETLAQKAAAQGATKAPEPVPLWAGILAAIGLVALLWVLHRFVLPRRAHLG
jgi:Squalene-hopene cyclase C-terminal domain